MLLGFGVAVVAIFALLMWVDARESREASAATAPTAETSAGDRHVRAAGVLADLLELSRAGWPRGPQWLAALYRLLNGEHEAEG